MNTIERGQAASNLLANPLLKEALDTIETTITEQWSSSSDSKMREELWYTLKGLQRFKTILEIAVGNGEADQAMMEKFDE